MRAAAAKFFTILLWAALIGLVYYVAYRQYEALPCLNPIEYKLGTIDPRFGVTQTEFLADIKQAGNIWSKGTGKNLFEYNANGPLTINLVYDSRQQITQQEHTISTTINSTTEVADSVKEQYTTLMDTYQNDDGPYETELAQFNQKQSDYNTEVTKDNNEGGAPPAEFKALQAEKQSLDSERAELEQKKETIDSLATQINALIDKYNLLVNHINENVDAINNDGLTGTEFEEGVYVSSATSTYIEIYQFDNQTAFIRVLAHEMGHSLGLGHNNGADSIMNPVNQSTSLTLSAQDLAAIEAECGESQGLPQAVQAFLKKL